MTLSAGTRLGPYEIVAPLGAGGMGEVYRAKDQRLGREVAIKVLPASFSSDPDRLRRFEQEARAAGLLNHPNITAVYDIGSENDAPYVVTELLEGETLRGALAGGRLSARKAIDYALQVAHGLAAAHEKGIVHRDLKPENLFVARDGRVKILDFGLAKLTHTEEGGHATNLPTATVGTEPGVVLGTLGYMSPEQVRGRPADARSDIFAFGAILYEMLSGKRAFQGDSAADTMSAILKEDPPELSVTNQSISPGLDRIVRHCLEKNPEQRFHSAHDLAFDLEALSGWSSSTGTSPSPATGRIRRRVPLGLAVPAVLAAVVAGVFADRALRKSAASAPVYHQLTYRHGYVSSARFAPDGQTIVFSARWEGNPSQVFMKRPESPDALALSVPPSEILAISSSGEMAIALNCVFTHNGVCGGTLAQAPLTGGTPRELQERVQQVDWSPSGPPMVLVHDVAGRARLEFPPGKVLYETSGHVSYPRISPKGNLIAFLDHPFPLDDRGSVAVMDLEGKKKTTLSTGWESEQGLAWSPSGEEVWFTAARAGSNRSLHAVTLSGGQRQVAGVPGDLTLRDISKTGRVLLTHGSTRLGIAALPPGETRERDLSWLEWSLLADLSDDGRTILFDEEGSAAGANYIVCLRKTDGSPLVRLGEGGAEALSPDGRWALARLPQEKAPDVLLPTGAGQPKTLPSTGLQHAGRAKWFPDGQRILFAASEPGHPPRLWIQDIGDGKRRPLTPEGFSGARFGVSISPDGKFIVAQDADRRTWIFPVAGGQARPLPAVVAGEEAPVRWSADGRSLFLRAIEGVPVKISQLDLETGRKTPWKEISPADLAGVAVLPVVLLSADGRAHAYTYSRNLSDLYVVDGLN